LAVRRALGTLICAVALTLPFGGLVALAPAVAAAAADPGSGGADSTGSPTDGSGAAGPGSVGALGTLGQTVLAAIASATSTDEALGALGNGLALIEARRKLEARAVSRESAPGGAHKLEATSAPTDPAKMPPASAGTNGTAVQRHSIADGEKIFAHTRAGDSSTSILLTGVALAPPDAPQAVKDVINNANMIVGRPYVWGGGHGSFYSSGYDCSGSVSFALFGGGLIPRPLTSSELESWGAPGPGRWITVYANGGHTFAEIAGLRWDTVGDEQGTGPRWHLAPTSSDGFVARHPAGY
jgi:cell wall-associated NlpC family hydrolase